MCKGMAETEVLEIPIEHKDLIEQTCPNLTIDFHSEFSKLANRPTWPAF